MSDVGYTTTEELGRILKITAPTDAQEDAMVRVLTMAKVEIDAEIDLADDADDLTDDQLALAAEVNLERAVELWRTTPFGRPTVPDGDLLVVNTAKDSWATYANKLAPLKDQWGIA